jgi:hypothetical protein
MNRPWQFEFYFGGNGGGVTTVRVILCTRGRWRELPERKSPLWASGKWGRFVLACSVGTSVPPAAETDTRVRFMQPVEFSAN